MKWEIEIGHNPSWERLHTRTAPRPQGPIISGSVGGVVEDQGDLTSSVAGCVKVRPRAYGLVP